MLLAESVGRPRASALHARPPFADARSRSTGHAAMAKVRGRQNSPAEDRAQVERSRGVTSPLS